MASLWDDDGANLGLVDAEQLVTQRSWWDNGTPDEPQEDVAESSAAAQKREARAAKGKGAGGSQKPAKTGAYGRNQFRLAQLILVDQNQKQKSSKSARESLVRPIIDRRSFRNKRNEGARICR